MAYSLGLGEPERFAALSRSVPGYHKTSCRCFPDVPATEQLPVLIQHGKRDELVDVGQCARRQSGKLRNLRVPVTYREYEMGHEINAHSLGPTCLHGSKKRYFTDCVGVLTVRRNAWTARKKNVQLVVVYPMTSTRDIHRLGLLERLDTTIFFGSDAQDSSPRNSKVGQVIRPQISQASSNIETIRGLCPDIVVEFPGIGSVFITVRP